jgi:tetratricopeptide (TPR) repeat protein
MAVTKFVDENFIERAEDAEGLVASIARQELTLVNLRRRFEENPTDTLNADIGRAIQRLSEWKRLAGDYQEALALKDEAIAVWAALGREKARTLTQLQKAETQHLAGDPESAYKRFELLIPRLTSIEEFSLYLDFAYEWLARCQIRDGLVLEALDSMSQCLVIREERGNASQLAYTRELVERMAALVPSA